MVFQPHITSFDDQKTGFYQPIQQAEPTNLALARLIPLKGFSGCEVLLVKKKGISFVRKTARDIAYNPRLEIQIEKQATFVPGYAFEAPKVLRVGQWPNKLTYFDMEYVQGLAAHEALAALPLAQIGQWAKRFAALSEVPVSGEVPADLFLKKISSLDVALSLGGQKTPEVQQVLNWLLTRDWRGIPCSPCHGDATLENVIVSGDRFYLIDFLDSFADSWYLDMAKLMQDLCGHWSFRHKPIDANLALRIAALRTEVEAFLQTRYPGALDRIWDIYLLNLLRILPYADAQDARLFVHQSLAKAPRTLGALI